MHESQRLRRTFSLEAAANLENGVFASVARKTLTHIGGAFSQLQMLVIQFPVLRVLDPESGYWQEMLKSTPQLVLLGLWTQQHTLDLLLERIDSAHIKALLKALEWIPSPDPILVPRLTNLEFRRANDTLLGELKGDILACLQTRVPIMDDPSSFVLALNDEKHKLET